MRRLNWIQEGADRDPCFGCSLKESTWLEPYFQAQAVLGVGCMESVKSQQSIHDLPPLEVGGVTARVGFAFQDHVVVSFCLEILENPDLREVWCETQDDITLIWVIGEHQEVEFVQVKDLKFDHLWSVAELCKRSKQGSRGLGTSILEKSLAHDRCSEPCRFRIVTSWEVNKDLAMLKFPLTSPVRERSNKDFDSLCEHVSGYVSDFTSENGNNHVFWLSRTVWEVGHTADAIETRNVQALADHVVHIGGHLTPGQIKGKVYPRLLELVKKQAEADWRVDPEAKKNRREEFAEWLKRILTEAQHPAWVGAGEDMQRKMEDASLPPDYVETAHEERRRYRQEVLAAQYLDVSNRELAIGEVYAELEHLRLKLDTGELSEGIAFYQACLSKMKELQHSLRTTKLRLPLFFLHGCMHDITDRCGHRYRRL